MMAAIGLAEQFFVMQFGLPFLAPFILMLSILLTAFINIISNRLAHDFPDLIYKRYIPPI
jgi:hypothetical protein